MRFSTQLSLAALVALASSTAIHIGRRDTPLSVKLTASGNTEVKVAVTNTGASDLNLLSKGTFLDEKAPVEKVKIYTAKAQVPFEGIRMRVKTSGLTEDAFMALAAGETKEITVETASLHTLSQGGVFDVFASGAIPFAKAGSTELAGSLAYASNKLTMNVNGALAAKVSKAIVKRTTIDSDCTGDYLTTVQNALSNCASLASAAASAADAGTDITTYFTSSSESSIVSARLSAVANECSSTSGGATTTHCTDTYSGCSDGVLAYTVPSANDIIYCDLFFTDLPDVSSTCHAQDQATTVIHENTHAPGVYSPGTEDYGYGYSAATALSEDEEVNNADSYALYSNAIYVGC
ncbi:neutral protease 2-like protein [Lepidopterella palustris CBS 459.81]|uniref:Neutral protease 2 n=1 Tax=Lepidopterella palustris CBS 459.81 TaxID=1314670 RepID=A0A8E2EKY3_9PEZI|nr:neutral protease 2-like protein [Lepidopterella palustris CBS 459.81]